MDDRNELIYTLHQLELSQKDILVDLAMYDCILSEEAFEVNHYTFITVEKKRLFQSTGCSNIYSEETEHFRMSELARIILL